MDGKQSCNIENRKQEKQQSCDHFLEVVNVLLKRVSNAQRFIFIAQFYLNEHLFRENLKVLSLYSVCAHSAHQTIIVNKTRKKQTQIKYLFQLFVQLFRMYPTPQVISNSLSQQSIKNAKYEIQQLEQFVESNWWIHTGSISNNLKYIVSGGDDKLLKIWKYNTCALMKTIRFDNCVQISKFTDDSQLLYVGISNILYQFYSDNQFRILCKLKIHTSVIINIICITSLLILTSSCDTILKTDVNRKQQLLKIQTQTEDIQALDFNDRLNQVACGSSNHTIKVCDGNDGSLIIEKLNAHNLTIIQLLFIISNNQLMSLDFNCNLKIWNINYQAQQLEQFSIIKNYGYNISLVLQQQYIVSTFIKTIQVHTIKGELVRQFDHNVETFYFNNTKQPDSMKGVLIQGICNLIFLSIRLTLGLQTRNGFNIMKYYNIYIIFYNTNHTLDQQIVILGFFILSKNFKGFRNSQIWLYLYCLIKIIIFYFFLRFSFMYLLVFVLLIKNLFVDGNQCCNNRMGDDLIIFDQNLDSTWNTEFTSDDHYLEDQLTLFTVSQQFIYVYVEESLLGFKCVIQHEKNQDIMQLELGAFQQIFIKFDSQVVELFWYQDFALIYNKMFKLPNNNNLVIKNNHKQLCWQKIQFKQIDSYLLNCQEKFHLNIQMNPLLQQIFYKDFNNNFYCLQFWIKQISENYQDSQIDIVLIGQNNIHIKIYTQQTIIILDGIKHKSAKQQQNIWNFHQMTYLRKKEIFEHQTLNTYQQVALRQQFEYLNLYAFPKKQNALFTGIKINMKKKSFNILCPPGCLNCDFQGQCLICDTKFQLLKGFCECEENFDFFISPSECYVQIDKQLKMIEKQKKSQKFPTYEGQECPQFQNEINGEVYNYCLYKTNITLQNKQIELEQNVYYLFVAYELVDDQYQIIFKELDEYYNDALNIIKLIENKYDIYLIGQTYYEQKICQKQYYHSKQCQQMNKKCQLQQIFKQCIICQDFYFLNYGQCKKCPKNCTFCKIINKQLICFSCINMYFLNFQRKCVPCQLQYCEQCYHYNGQLNTLESNFKIQVRSFLYYVGCSYCQNLATLNLNERICNLENQGNKLRFYYKSFVSSNDLNKLFQQHSENCGLNCIICYDICFICDNNYYFDLQLNRCRAKYNIYQDITIYNKHTQDQLFNLVTMVFQNYNISQLISNKYKYFYINCELLYQHNNYQHDLPYCKSMNFNALNKKCQFYCDKCFKNETCIDYKYNIIFNVNFTMQRIENQLFIVNDYNYYAYVEGFQINSLKNEIQYKITIDQNYIDKLYLFGLVNYMKHYITCIIMQFTNITIQYDILNIQSQEFLIQHSNIIVLDQLFLTSDNMLLFSMLNVTLRGIDDKKSEFQIDQRKLIKFELCNVQLTNIQNIDIQVFSVSIDIKDVSLNNLVIENGLIFQLMSTITVIEKLIIQNCTFNNTIIFDIKSTQLHLTEIVIEYSQFINSTIFLIFDNETDIWLYAESININQVSFYQSQFISFIRKIKSLVINNMIIQQSNIKYSKLIAIQIQQFLGKIYDRQPIQKITNSYIIESEFYASNITIFGESLQIDNFTTNQSKITGLLFFIWTELILILNMNFIGCQFYSLDNKVDLKDMFNLQSKDVKINGMYFYDIIISITVIKLSYSFATITNIQFQQIQTYNCNMTIIYIGHEQSIESNIGNLFLSNLYDNQLQNLNPYSLMQIASTQIFVYSTEMYNINSNFTNLIGIFGQIISFKVLIAKNLTAYSLFYTETSSVQFKNLKLISSNIQQHILEFVLQGFECILIIDDFEMKQSIIKKNIIHIDAQETRLVEIKNILIFKVKCEIVINIIINKLEIINIHKIDVSQSKLSSIYNMLGICQFLHFHFISIHDVEFNECIHSIFIESQQLKFQHIMINKVIKCNLQVLFQIMIFVNFTVSHSNIKYLGFYQFEARNYNIIYDGLLLYNNIFSYEQCKSFLGLKLVGQDQLFFLKNLNLIDNKIMERNDYLLELKGEMMIQINIVDNICQNYCINVLFDSEIKFDHFIADNYYNDQLIRIHTSSTIYSFESIQPNKRNLAIRINNRIVLINQQIIPIPSGQQLINYQIYQKEQLKQYFHNIQIIQYQDNQDYVVQGEFTIQAYEYDVYEKKVIQDLNQFQSFNSFYQNKTYSGLLYYQINFNPYQKNILMIKIQQVGNLEQQITIFARTQICQMGEILYNDQCLVCDPKLQIYSVKQKSNFCQTVDQLIISDHSQGQIKLREGFWRPFPYSSQIEQCEGQLSQCLGGWDTGDNSCQIGYIGGVCKACDVNNIKGHGYYSYENSSCILCSESQQYQILLLKLLVVLLIYCLSLMLQINSNLQIYKKLVLQRLINYRNFHILVKYIQDLPPMIFNVNIANLAFLNFIMQDFIDLPNVITIFTNPIIIEKSSSTCLQLITNLNWSYWHLILRVIMPILIYNTFIILAMISSYYKKQIKNIFLYPVISLFFSQGPTIFVLFIQSTVYINYSKIRYAYFDYSIRYFSRDHQKNLKYIILPIILIFSFILPLIIYSIMKKIKKNLFKGQTYMIGGNFILPYKNTYYEIYKYFKNSILLIILILNDKFLVFYNKALIYIVIVQFEKQNKIHKVKKISLYIYKQGIWLICLLLSSNYLEQLNLPTTHVIYILVALFIFQSLTFYFNLIFISNKFDIYEALQNKKRILIFLGLKNYQQCLNQWKFIKLNYKDFIKGKQIKQRQGLNQLILKKLDQSVEIEMREL